MYFCFVKQFRFTLWSFFLWIRKKFDFAEAYDVLRAYGVSEQTLMVACLLTGNTLETLDNVCFALFGHPSVDSLVKRM